MESIVTHLPQHHNQQLRFKARVVRGSERHYVVAAPSTRFLLLSMGVATLVAFQLTSGVHTSTELLSIMKGWDAIVSTQAIMTSSATEREHAQRTLSAKEINGSSHECWVEWDKQRKIQMEWWFEHDVPVMITAVHGTRKEEQAEFDIAYAQFTQGHLKKELWPEEWMCLYKGLDQSNAERTRAQGAVQSSCDLFYESLAFR